jgi:hypothetical protein
MASCKAESGLTTSCEDLLRVGGLAKTFWVGYLSELDTQISLAQAADVNALDFGSYGGLRRFDGIKFSHSAGYEVQRAAGGTISYKHSVSVKLLSDSTADDVILQDLSLGQDIFVIAEDNNRDFFIFGAGNGLTVESGAQNSGETGDADARVTMVFSGQEKTLPIRFEVAGSYQATVNYIQSFEV